MQIRFNLDPDTGLPHIAQHGVTELEVREVLSSETVQDRPARRASRVALGQTRAGRFLKVIYAPAWDDTRYIHHHRLRTLCQGGQGLSPAAAPQELSGCQRKTPIVTPVAGTAARSRP